jgi:hypothetical protein|uniref:Uncharacterized protein n=1 Tax=Siphoviridae sp. ctDsE1 TaxID=2825390 RepID=A0A8S5TYH4_9CAUD|nr:MAG TPA: hypothetical protein [Siphoviridae sp. ctDsE1]
MEEKSIIAQTVAQKFTQMDDSGKAYLMGYILGNESEQHPAPPPQAEPAPA